MLDKKKILKEITGNKNFNITVSEPFNHKAIEFLNDFSNALKKQKKTSIYPDLIYLMFWCSKNRITSLAKNNTDYNNTRLGRGLVFHVTPSNVPTNFIYSFFFGLLSGNSNIIKIPSKKFQEKKIILSALKSILNKKKYSKIKFSNLFIEFDNKSNITEKISSISDARVIWGGDQTINEIRKIWTPPRTIDLTFADRYSLSIINLNRLKNKNTQEIKLLAKNFFYDGYLMNQAACNSPHFIFWSGKKNNKIQNFFWKELSVIVKKKFLFDNIHVVDKYTNLVNNIIIHKNFKSIKRYKNYVYVLEPNKKISQIENIRGSNGTFFQKNIRGINNLKKYITKKCQTVSYFGFEKNELKKFILNSNLLGADRFVPIGKALDIDIVWDGYEVVKSLSRTISL